MYLFITCSHCIASGSVLDANQIDVLFGLSTPSTSTSVPTLVAEQTLGETKVKGVNPYDPAYTI